MLYLRPSPSGGLFKKKHKYFLGLNALQKVENMYFIAQSPRGGAHAALYLVPSLGTLVFECFCS